MSTAELTPENVETAFLDSLSRAHDPAEVIITAQGLSEDIPLHAERLYTHVFEIELMLSHAATAFYEDRGGGHTCLDLGLRRDGYRWGDSGDVERLLALGVGLNLVSYCRRDRDQWRVFPEGIPYVKIKSTLFRMWARFRSGAATWVVPFDTTHYPPPRGIEDASWYAPRKIKVNEMGETPKHVTEAFYSDLVVRGFFEAELPSWILNQDTVLQVY